MTLAVKGSYVLVMRRGNTMWFLFDIDTSMEPHCVMWTLNEENAFRFPDNETAEAFMYDFVQGRDVEVLRVKSKWII